MKSTAKPSYLRGVDLSNINELESSLTYYRGEYARSYNKVIELEAALQEVTHLMNHYHQVVEDLHKHYEKALKSLQRGKKCIKQLF